MFNSYSPTFSYLGVTYPRRQTNAAYSTLAIPFKLAVSAATRGVMLPRLTTNSVDLAQFIAIKGISLSSSEDEEATASIYVDVTPDSKLADALVFAPTYEEAAPPAKKVVVLLVTKYESRIPVPSMAHVVRFAGEIYTVSIQEGDVEDADN